MFHILLCCHLNFLQYKHYYLQHVFPFHCTSNQTVLREQLTIHQTVKNLSLFIETEGSLPHSQTPASCLLHGTKSMHYMSEHSTSWWYILIIFPQLRQRLPIDTFQYIIPTKTLHAPVQSPIRAHVLPISIQMIWSTEQNPVKNKLHTTPHYAAFCTPPHFHCRVTSSFIGPNIHLNTIFSKILNLNITEQFHSIQCSVFSSLFSLKYIQHLNIISIP